MENKLMKEIEELEQAKKYFEVVAATVKLEAEIKEELKEEDEEEQKAKQHIQANTRRD